MKGGADATHRNLGLSVLFITDSQKLMKVIGAGNGDLS